jgi:tetratricopeptide (TPR) repeat protein
MIRSLARLTPVFAVAATLSLAPMAGRAQTPDGGDAGAYLAARSAAVNDDYAEGARWFARSLEADPTNGALLEGLVISEISQGRIDAAAGAAQRLTAAGGRSIAANIALLARDAKAGDFPAILAAPPERNIGNLIDQLVKAWAEFGNGRMTEAVAGFDAISATDGLKIFGLYHKSLALATVGDFEGADAILSGREAGPLAVNRRGIVAHVQILSQLERFDDALAMLDRAFGTEPEPHLASMRAGLAARKPLPFDVVTTAQDGIAEVFFTLAVALNGEAQDGYTLLYARVAADLNPRHAEARLLTAGLLEQQGQPALAKDVYGTFAENDPAYYSAQIGLSGTLGALGQQAGAIAVIKALTVSHPDLSVVHMTYGDLLRQDDQFDAAADAYSAAIALIEAPQDRHWGLYYSRAVAFERAGKWPEAEADFRKSLSLSPGQPQVLNYLGYSFVDRNENLDEALGLIERAVAARPDAGYIIDSLGWAYYRLGRYNDALVQMERASLLEPVDPVVTDHLGDVYWAVGRKLEARFQWRRALSFKPEETDAARIRRKLDVGLDVVLAEDGAPPLKARGNATD